MKEFINDVDYFISYASSISEFKLVPESTRQSIETILFEAIDIRNAYHESLGEKVEELEERAEDICAEMEIFDAMMRKNESILDECLVYIDNRPIIQLQFGIGIFFISESGEC
jgi:hypothetical protein